jgi:hypothetical protein
MPEKNKLNGERFILPQSFRGFSLQSLVSGPVVRQYIMMERYIEGKLLPHDS